MLVLLIKLLRVPNLSISLKKDVLVMSMNLCQDDYARNNQSSFQRSLNPKYYFQFFIPCDLSM